MKRLLLVFIVATLLVTAGCVDSTTIGNDDISAETDDPSDVESGEDESTGATPDADSTESDSASDGETDGDGEDDTTPSTDGTLEIHHIDVGQADATLLVEPGGETMLIDSGDWRNGGADVIDYLEERDIDRIDHLVATHGHADHIGGHDEIIAHYETERDGIGLAYDSGVAATSQTYERYLDAVETHDVELLTVESGDSFAFGGVAVDVFNPPAGESGTDLHYNSVTFSLTFGEFTYLTTGDAERDAEAEMIEEHGEALEATVYHAGHHGSSTSSTGPFMDAVAPEVAVISSAFESQYGHPHDEVLESFAERGIDTYWTGVHGDIVLRTDGEEYTVTPEHEFSTDGDDLLEEKPADDDGSTASLLPPINVAPAPISG